MRNFHIHFNDENTLPDGNILGNQGEHNATVITVTPPAEMTENENIISYRIAFELSNCRTVHSVDIAKADIISLPLSSQITSSETIAVQLEGYDNNGDILVKSEKVTKLKFNPSVCGVEIPPSDSPNSMAAEVKLNTTFRKKLEDNAETLDKLTTSENGKLLFDGKEIEGVEGGTSSENGATFTPSVDEEGNISWTNDKGLPNPETVNIKGEQGVSGVYVGSGDMPEGYNIQIDPEGEAAVIPTKTSELINDSGYLTAEDLFGIEPNLIPDYWNEHLANKIKAIKSNQEKGGKDCFSFIIITDIHYDQNLGKRSPLLAKKIMEECNIKYALVLGDFVTRSAVANEAEMENNFIGVSTMLQPLSGKALITQGNHDGAWGQYDANGDGTISGTDYYCFNYSPAKMYERIYRPVSCVDGLHFDNSGTGYYVDDTANRVRYIMLNTHCVKYQTNSDGTAVNNTMRTFRCTQSQFDMLIEALRDIPSDDWNVIVGSHIPVMDGFDYNGDGNNDYFLSGSDIPLIRRLLTAFNNKESYAESFGTADTWEYVSINADFTDAKGRVLGCFAGHTHADINLSETTAGIPVVITRCDSQNENLDDLYAERVKETVTEQSFDVVTVDKVNHIAYITKIGAGNSREISLDDTAVYSITNSLQNALIDNDLKVIRENSSYSANITAETGYELSSVSVSMGGVDITASVYSDGTIYIESVTGDISITATATATASYTNLIPLYGYKTDTRISSSTGEEKAETGMCCTGFIPCLSGQTIRIANVTMIGSTGVSYIIIYDGNKNFINAVNTNDMTENNGVYSYSPSQGTMAFIRLSIGEITDESIVTIDEEIGA